MNSSGKSLAACLLLALAALFLGASDVEANGRWKWSGSQCVFDENDSGPNQCTPGETPNPAGRWKWMGDRCEWDANDDGPNQCTPASITVPYLSSGQQLLPGQSIESASHRYRLTNTSEGWLVLTERGYPIWSQGPFGYGTLDMQSDGNLVFYSGGAARWDSGTWGQSGATLWVQNDGNVVLYAGGNPVWASGTAAASAGPGQLLAGGEIGVGGERFSPNAQYRLVNQGDGNLVLYRNSDGAPLWWSGTGATGPLQMQYDGNLVLRRLWGSPWHAGTHGHPGAVLSVLNSGNVEIRSAWGSLLWQTDTGLPETPTGPPRITINGVDSSGGAVNVDANSTFSVVVHDAPLGDHYRVALFRLNDCCTDAQVVGLQSFSITARPQQTFTFTAPNASAEYQVVLIDTFTDPISDLVAGPRVSVRQHYLSVDGVRYGGTVVYRLHRPVTVQVHNAVSPTDRVAWFRYIGTVLTLVGWQPVGENLNGSVTISLPLRAGFHLRLLSSTNQERGRGPEVLVPEYKVLLRPTESAAYIYSDVTAADGDTVRAIVAVPGVQPGDRLGLFAVGAPDGSPLAEHPVSGSGQEVYEGNWMYGWDVAVPSQSGQYEVRYLEGGTNVRLGTSAAITVTTDPGTANPVLTLDGKGVGDEPLVRPPSAGKVSARVQDLPATGDYYVALYKAGFPPPGTPASAQEAVFRAASLGYATVDLPTLVPGGDAANTYISQLFRSADHAPSVLGPTVIVRESCPDPPCVEQGIDTHYYYSTDAIGSVRVITDQNGGVAARKDYLPFGTEWESTSTPEGDRVTFGGYEIDHEAQGSYAGFRYFLPRLGRFEKPDDPAIAQDVTDPQSFNLFAYARNNPLTYRDPSGHAIVVGMGPTEEDIAFNAQWRDWVLAKVPEIFQPTLDKIASLFLPVSRDEWTLSLNLDLLAMRGTAVNPGRLLRTARLTQEGLDHIVLRHWATSGAQGAGKFSSGTTGRGLKGLINQALEKGTIRANTQGRPGHILEHNFCRQIGVGIGGDSATRLRMVVSTDGTIVTAFPY